VNSAAKPATSGGAPRPELPVRGPCNRDGPRPTGAVEWTTTLTNAQKHHILGKSLAMRTRIIPAAFGWSEVRTLVLFQACVGARIGAPRTRKSSESSQSNNERRSPHVPNVQRP
jgi:hypothetical protein